MTDDVSIVEALGRPVRVTRGSYTNIKVQTFHVGQHHLHLQTNNVAKQYSDPCLVTILHGLATHADVHVLGFFSATLGSLWTN